MGLGASPVKLANEIGGLHLPRVTHLWAQTARGSGRQWRGSRLESREFSLNVYIPDLSDAALFFEALSYETRRSSWSTAPARCRSASTRRTTSCR
jgi:hypothetical protein